MSEAAGTYIRRYSHYLEDARRRLYATVVWSVAGFVAGFLATPFALKAGVQFFAIEGVMFTTTSPFQLIDLAVDAGFFSAMLVAVPLALYHIYAFLHSALVPGERRTFFLLLPLALVLFAAGFAYGFGVLYYALGAIARINEGLGIANLWDINRFASQIALTSMLLGLLFQFPLVLVLLARLGVITPGFLSSKRRHAAVVILLMVALLPPTDGLSFVVMAAPLIAMYEAAIFAVRGQGSAEF